MYILFLTWQGHKGIILAWIYYTLIWIAYQLKFILHLLFYVFYLFFRALSTQRFSTKFHHPYLSHGCRKRRLREQTTATLQRKTWHKVYRIQPSKRNVVGQSLLLKERSTTSSGQLKAVDILFVRITFQCKQINEIGVSFCKVKLTAFH